MLDDDIFDLIEQNDLDKINAMLDGADGQVADILRALGPGGSTPLMAALRNYERRLVTPEKNTALNIVRALIASGQRHYPALLTAADDSGTTPLGVAILLHSNSLAMQLCAATEILSQPCHNAFLPLDLCLTQGQAELAAFMVNRGATATASRLNRHIESLLVRRNEPLPLMFYQACRRAPQAARLIAALMEGDTAAVAKLAADPDARWPISRLAWDHLAHILLARRDREFSLLAPYLQFNCDVSDLIAKAIDQNAIQTFNVLVENLNWNYQLDSEDVVQYLQWLSRDGRSDWAIDLLRQIAVLETMPEVPITDIFLNGTPVTMDMLTARGVIPDSVSLTVEESDGVMGVEDTPLLLSQNPNMEACLGDIVTAILAHPDDTFADHFSIFAADEALDDVPDTFFGRLLQTHDYDGLKRLLRLMFSQTKLTQQLPYIVNQIRDHQALRLLLFAGACPTFNDDGDIMEGGNIVSFSLCKHMVLYRYLRAAVGGRGFANWDGCAALTLMAIDCPTVFSTEDGIITLYNLAESDNDPALARLLAVLGVSPIHYLSEFLRSPAVDAEGKVKAEVQAVIEAILAGLDLCWKMLEPYGFHARWLFANALIWHFEVGGDDSEDSDSPTIPPISLVSLLDGLSECDILATDIKVYAKNLATLFDDLMTAAEEKVEPLTSLIFRQTPLPPETLAELESMGMLPLFMGSASDRKMTEYLMAVHDKIDQAEEGLILPPARRLLANIMAILYLMHHDQAAALEILAHHHRRLGGA